MCAARPVGVWPAPFGLMAGGPAPLPPASGRAIPRTGNGPARGWGVGAGRRSFASPRVGSAADRPPRQDQQRTMQPMFPNGARRRTRSGWAERTCRPRRFYCPDGAWGGGGPPGTATPVPPIVTRGASSVSFFSHDNRSPGALRTRRAASDDRDPLRAAPSTCGKRTAARVCGSAVTLCHRRERS